MEKCEELDYVLERRKVMQLQIFARVTTYPLIPWSKFRNGGVAYEYSLTKSEYDAISFAWSQITTEVEACSDNSFTIEAGEAINQLSSIQDKYREAKRKSEIFYAVRAKFKERFPEASSSTLGKLARKAIKISKEKK